MNNKPFVLFVLILILLFTGCRTTGGEREGGERPALGHVERLEPQLDALLPGDAVPEILASGFEWTEGPLWVGDEDGYLLFSDIPVNTIYRWSEGEGLQPYMRPAGYCAPDPAGDELGTNGLVLDPQGRLVVCDHGNRMVARVDTTTFTKTPLAASYRGQRLNSPNDAVYKSNGDLYFTDPPYGLDGLNDSPAKELPFNGVYRLQPDGTITLLTDELTFPNGIAFSPDERTLYVAVSDPQQPVIMAYDVQADGTISPGRVFFDAAALREEGGRGLPDGMAVDQQGNLWATGPGGVLIIAPDGTHLGTINTGQATANCTFGGDGSVLYITADMYLARIRTSTRGLGY